MNYKFILLSCLLGYQNNCFSHSLDKYSVVYPDIIEVVKKEYVTVETDQKLIIEHQVQTLIDDIIIYKRKTGRSYRFFSIENTFTRQDGDQESYVFYVVLCIEFEPHIFENISKHKKDRIQKLMVKNLLKLYESKSIEFKKVLPGCYVSCVEIGIDKLLKHSI